MQDVRLLSRSLLPPLLDEEGLGPALASCARRSSEGGFDVRLRAGRPRRPRPPGARRRLRDRRARPWSTRPGYSGADGCAVSVTVQDAALVGHRARPRQRDPRRRALRGGSAVHAGACRRARRRRHGRAARTRRHPRARGPAPRSRPRPEPLVTISVVLVDDHPVFRIGMAALLDSLAGIRVTGQAASAAEAASAARLGHRRRRRAHGPRPRRRLRHRPHARPPARAPGPARAGGHHARGRRRRGRGRPRRGARVPGEVRAARRRGARGPCRRGRRDDPVPRRGAAGDGATCSAGGPLRGSRSRSSPTGSARSSTWSPPGWTTRRSPGASGSAPRPCATTWPTCWPGSALPDRSAAIVRAREEGLGTSG